MTAVVLIALGGGGGAVLRWLVTRADQSVPWAMMAANVVASAGAAVCADLDGSVRWLVNVGLLGALSTWSSLAVSAAKLVRSGETAKAIAVLGGTVMASVAAAAVLL